MWWLEDDGFRCQIFGAFSVLIAGGILASWFIYTMIYIPTLLWTVPVLAPILLFVVGALLALIELRIYKKLQAKEEDPFEKTIREWWQD
jgi:hypothetical protein